MSLSISLYFGILIFSFIVTSVAIVPFINLLYKLKFRRREQLTLDPMGVAAKIFDQLHSWKAGTPVGGGLLVIVLVSLMFFILFPTLQKLGIYIHSAHAISKEIVVIFFTFISYGLLGLYDDLLKFFRIENRKFFGLRFRHKFVIQWVLALIIGYFLYRLVGINYVHIPIINYSLSLGWLYVLFASFFVVAFANAYNITDGLDGLSPGVLLFCLFALWGISSTVLDTVLSLFLSLWLGSLVAFLYFNVYPARIWLGDVGALSFGATLAVVGLLLGKPLALLIIGGVFVAEGGSSLVQLTAKKFFKRKVLPVAPLHLTLQKIGWEEPKIVFRAWLAALMLGIFGLWMATL